MDVKQLLATLAQLGVAARPQRFVAQEWVRVSQGPVLERGAGTGMQRGNVLAPRAVGLRVFAGGADPDPGVSCW
mgnify:CR=1 FL=1